jgi:hypothetical protein
MKVFKKFKCKHQFKIRNMKNAAKIVVILFLLALPALGFGQPTNPDGWEDGTNVEDVHVPFDDGVSLLVGIGVLYGLMRVRAQRKNRQSKEEILLC